MLFQAKRNYLFAMKWHFNTLFFVLSEVVEQRVSPGSQVLDPESGKKVGIVRAALGCRGLGILRLEEAFKCSGALSIQGQEDVKVETSRPDWWPTEWFQEYEQQTVVA